jgi:hypothetical protein
LLPALERLDRDPAGASALGERDVHRGPWRSRDVRAQPQQREPRPGVAQLVVAHRTGHRGDELPPVVGREHPIEHLAPREARKLGELVRIGLLVA